MSIVVEQTLPYTPSELKLEDPNRWNRLFSLIRPSIKAVESSKGQTIVLDTALCKSNNVLVAAVTSIGNLSTEILAESTLAAFATEQEGSQSMPVNDISQILKDHGFPTENGVVVVRSGPKQDLRLSGAGVAEVKLEQDLGLDHVLSLISSSNPETKSSFDKTTGLLQHFIEYAVTTTSEFQEKKLRNGPSIIHAAETAEFSSAKSAIEKDLGHILSLVPTTGTDVVYSVHYSDVNGLSRLENNILAHEISEYFAKKSLSSYITQSTIASSRSQARGWAISICPIPSTFLSAQPRPSNLLSSSTSSAVPHKAREGKSAIQISDSQVRKIITAGCDCVIKDEPTITEYDTIVGDGDCGYTLRDGAKQVLSFIKNEDLSKLPSALSDLVDDLEVNMGGTSGALYCIFLSSLAQNLWDAPTFPDALKGSLDHLLKYTRARLGDRTCLDCLIPFVETLKETGDSKKALQEAEKGVETTKKLEAKLGRSSYLDESATRGVPDPGAYGLLKLLEGMVGAQ